MGFFLCFSTETQTAAVSHGVTVESGAAEINLFMTTLKRVGRLCPLKDGFVLPCTVTWKLLVRQGYANLPSHHKFYQCFFKSPLLRSHMLRSPHLRSSVLKHGGTSSSWEHGKLSWILTFTWTFRFSVLTTNTATCCRWRDGFAERLLSTHVWTSTGRLLEISPNYAKSLNVHWLTDG